MIILSCLPFFFTGFNYLFSAFILMFIFGLIFKIVRA